MRIFPPLCALVIVLSGCKSTPPPETETVIGRLTGPGIAPSNAQVFTMPLTGGGVKVYTDVGRGVRAVTLNPYNTIRLITAIETTLVDWKAKTESPPFKETLMGGAAEFQGTNPFSLQLAKTPQMVEPVFLLEVGYYDATAALVLNRQNASIWVRKLRAITGTGG